MTPTSLPSRPGRRAQRSDALALGLGAAVLYAMGDDDGSILCPFRRCTGGYCPLCGTTRSAAALARFDLASSWSRHPAVVVVAVQIVLLGIIYSTGRALSDVIRNRMLGANALVLLSIWGLRLWSGRIPAPTGLQMPF